MSPARPPSISLVPSTTWIKWMMIQSQRMCSFDISKVRFFVRELVEETKTTDLHSFQTGENSFTSSTHAIARSKHISRAAFHSRYSRAWSLHLPLQYVYILCGCLSLSLSHFDRGCVPPPLTT